MSNKSQSNNAGEVPKKGKRRVTVLDVARRAEVSQGTVSNVLNETRVGRPVSRTTRNRVLSATAELGYVPHRAASMLSSGISQTVAIHFSDAVLPIASNPIRAEIHARVAIEAAKHGYRVVLHINPEKDRSSRDGQDILELAQARSVDGLLAVGCLTAKEVETAQAQGLPVIHLDWILPELTVEEDESSMADHAIHYFGIDVPASATALVEHFRSFGHEQLVFAGPFEKNPWSDAIADAFVDALSRRVADLDREASKLNVEWHGSEQGGYMLTPDGGKRLQALLADGITGVICVDDGTAVEIMDQVRHWGLQVPRDISVAGFGSTAPPQFLRPVLTTTRAPFDAIIPSAFEELLALIRGETVYPRRSLFPAEVVARNSVAPPREHLLNLAGYTE
ncbi:MAG: substrate-binding domain-containing protein [Nitrospiraceae bacterium]|nr:substrate-binding domain-containing protein [Nitrospiraceae bacterium]